MRGSEWHDGISNVQFSFAPEEHHLFVQNTYMIYTSLPFLISSLDQLPLYYNDCVPLSLRSLTGYANFITMLTIPLTSLYHIHTENVI